MSKVLTVAFCLCEGVTLSDFITPSEILASWNISFKWRVQCSHYRVDLHEKLLFGEAEPYTVKFDFVAPTMDPVQSLQAPRAPTLNPTKTYEAALAEGIQYDIIWVPACMFLIVTI